MGVSVRGHRGRIEAFTIRPSLEALRWLAVIAVVAVLGIGAAGIRSWHAPRPAVAVSALASLSIVDTTSASDLLARFDFPEVTATRVAVVEISWHSLGNPCGLVAVVHPAGSWGHAVASAGDVGTPVGADTWRSIALGHGQRFALDDDQPVSLGTAAGRAEILFALDDLATETGKSARVSIADRCGHGTPSAVQLTVTPR